jgi:hypothetical protein
MSSRLPSLNEILEEVRAEREGQNAHFDALDSKAGILLGFAGALVALTPTEDHLLVDVGRMAAVLAAALALWAFWPRRYSVTNLRVLRDRYLTADPRFTQKTLLDTHIQMAEQINESLRRKVWRVKAAMVALGAAALLVAIGVSVR